MDHFSCLPTQFVNFFKKNLTTLHQIANVWYTLSKAWTLDPQGSLIHPLTPVHALFLKGGRLWNMKNW